MTRETLLIPKKHSIYTYMIIYTHLHNQREKEGKVRVRERENKKVEKRETNTCTWHPMNVTINIYRHVRNYINTCKN